MTADTDRSGGSVAPSDEVSTRDTLLELGAILRPRLQPPFSLGRYQVTAELGHGGAGVVYRARDPELAREVAIKVVLPRAHTDRARERLLGEAQAIARLSHPNVVSVYDVGELPATEGGVPAGIYMVMELLEGVSLRAWLRQRGRGTAAVLDVLIAAGRGLEAAHRAGLVHRDFKPGNVLVGDTGRVHVLDFGLALAEMTPSDGDAIPHSAPTVEVSGTPAYMAPEQHAGATNDARTDLFAFCATCWEALHGVQPYTGRTLDELQQSKALGCGPPPTRRPPRAVQHAITRGLAPDPSDRPNSMTALLRQIERGRHRRRNVAIAAGLVTVVGGGLALAWASSADNRACVARGDERLASAWNDDVRERARSSFASVALPYAADTWTRVEGLLDERAAAWRDARHETCTGSVGEGATAVEHAAAALACLDDQLDELGARVEVFAHADEDVVRQAARMAERTPRAERCLDAAWVAAEHDAFGGELETELVRIRLQFELGHYDTSLAAAQATAVAAADAGDRRRHARALLHVCRALAPRRQPSETIRACTDAWVAAERADSDNTSIAAMLELLSETPMEQEPEATRLARLVRARLDARPEAERDPGLESDLALRLAQRSRRAGRWDEATQEAQRAYDITAALRGAGDSAVVSSLNELALSAKELGRLERARELFAQASKILLDTRGSGHPDVLSLENNVAGLEIALGRYDAAAQRLERVSAEKRALVGDRSAWLLTTMYQQVAALVELHRRPEALRIAREALTIGETTLGRDSPELVSPLLGMVWALRADDKCDDALAELARLDTILSRSAASDKETRASAELAHGRCLDRLGRSAEAGPRLERAVSLHEALYGAGGRHVAEALLALGRWHREHGSKATAAALLERAASICTNTEGDPELGRAVAAELETLR